MRYDDLTSPEVMGLWTWQDKIADLLKKRLSAVNASWGSYGTGTAVNNMHRGYIAALGAGVPLPRASGDIPAMSSYIVSAVNVPDRVATQFVTLMVSLGTTGQIPYNAYDPVGYKQQEQAKKSVTGEKGFLENIMPKVGAGLAIMPLLAIGGLLAVGFLLKQAAPVAREVRRTLT